MTRPSTCSRPPSTRFRRRRRWVRPTPGAWTSTAPAAGITHIGPELIAHRPYDILDGLQRIDGIGRSRVQDIKDQGLAATYC